MEERFRSGRELLGDDLDACGIAAWFADEREAYAKMSGPDGSAQGYGYHALNRVHGFRFLSGKYPRLLAYGSAHGEEVRPIAHLVEQAAFLDSSASFEAPNLPGVRCSRALAQENGDLPFDDGCFELITCFGVLHHVPNVSHVLGEMRRVLVPGGLLLVREPVTSMGDWARPRPGLTPRERGIPKAWMLRALQRTGLEVVSCADCFFPPVMKLAGLLGMNAFASSWWSQLDALAAGIFSWHHTYFMTSVLRGLRPGSAFYVVRAPLSRSLG